MKAATKKGGTHPTPAQSAPAVAAPKRERQLSSAALFTCAGVAVTLGNLANELYASLRGALFFFVIGLIIGFVAVRRSGKEIFDTRLGPETRKTLPIWSLWAILVLLIFVHLLLAVTLCQKLHPVIDTYTFQRDATKLLLSGTDPYGTTQPNPFGPSGSRYFGPGMVTDGRIQVGFQYPPLTLFWLVPGYLLGDVRFSYIFAVVLSAVLLFAAYPNVRTFWVVSALLLNFVTVRVEFYSWTEPLVLLTVCATLFAAALCPRWVFIPLGLFLAAKQYDLLVLPFIAGLVTARDPFSWKAYWRLVAGSCAVGAATLVPFVIWNPRGLWHDLVLFHLAQPFRTDALSLAVLAPFLLKAGPFLLLAYLVWATRIAARNVGTFAAAFGLALLIAFLTGKQAFANYYFLIGNLLLFYPAVQPGMPLLSRTRPGSLSQ
jgi:hypothetical protein